MKMPFHILLIASIAITLSACSVSTSDTVSETITPQNQIGENLMQEPTQPQVTELISEDVVVGEGTLAEAGDTVSVHYTGTLLDGTKFDSSVDRGTPFSFDLGAGMVIQGWDEGVAGMKEGGTRILTIPADMAYGERGVPGAIPPSAPLKFEVQLIEVEKAE